MTIDFNGNLQMLKWIKNILTQINKNKIGKAKITPLKSIYRWSLHGKNAEYFFDIFSNIDSYKIERKWKTENGLKVYNLNDYVRGWFIGKFLPSVFITDKFEIGIKEYKKGDTEARHYHKEAIEFTCITTGFVRMNGVVYGKNEIIIIDKKEDTNFEALTDCVTVVVKIPSVKNDKYMGEYKDDKI